jgi:hypothetical protein
MQLSLSPESDSALRDVVQFFECRPDLAHVVGNAMRKSFDEVIDGARTGRYCVAQLEKTEKTYIGTKVEIVLRDELQLDRGRSLDNLICGHEVDTKFSLSGGWMIPREAVGEICLLVKCADEGRFSIGVLRTIPEMLTKGKNQDGKRSVSAHGKKHIHWMCDDHPMPPNFLQRLDSSVRTRILSAQSGMQRIRELFLNVNGQIIPRSVIEQVARQRDPLRRARQMKEKLKDQGVVVLCSTYESDRVQFKQFGYTDFGPDDWLSIRLP